MAQWLAIGILFGAIFIGIFMGALLVKIVNIKKNKKLLKNLMEVLEGKRSNVLEIEGKKYDASKFLLRDEQGNETLVDLKGGKNGKEEIKKIEEGSNIEELPSIARKDSRSIGEEKRNIRSRFRRFG